MKRRSWHRSGFWGACGIAAISVAVVVLPTPQTRAYVSTGGIAHVVPDALYLSHARLPDGSMLDVDGAAGRAYVRGGDHPRAIALPEVRRYGSVTVLAGGQVLLWGGVDAQGNVLQTGEWFDPVHDRFVRTGKLTLPARAGHSMTLLADGSLWMAGGWDEQGRLSDEAERWDPTSGMTQALPLPASSRIGMDARLELDGSVRLSGGFDLQGRPVGGVLRIDPQHGHPSTITAHVEDDAKPVAITTSPGNETADVPVTGPLSLRFSSPVRAADLNTKSITLLGPEGLVPVRVVGTNDGRQAFVQLPDDLYPASTYTLFLKGIHSDDGAEFPFTSVGFTTAQSVASGVAIAGQGARRSAPVNADAGGDQAPLFIMAGDAKPVCDKDKAELCRPHSFIKDGAFYPGKDNMPDWQGNHWRLYAKYQSIPDTRAYAATLQKGDTALVGQIRQIDETPVANVEVSIGERKVHTDARGMFVLKGLAPGRQEVLVDGASASRGGIKYGRFVVGADVKARTLTSMPFVMYLPRILARDEIDLPAPTSRETVLTHPDMPGLELHIPAGAVFKDRNGHVLTHIAIVPTPVDHAPFPLPDNFPMYFTIQPGDAVVQGLTPEAAKGIRVVYPNYGKGKARTTSNFWVYNVQDGWRMYGGGHVTDNLKQIAPDPGVSLVWAMGAGVSVEAADPPTPKKPDNKCTGEPIDDQTGAFFHEWSDLAVKDVLPGVLDRAYTSADTGSHAFGVGASSSLAMHLYSADNSLMDPQLVLPCGEAIAFHLVAGNSTNWPLSGDVWEHTATKSKFYGAMLQFFTNTPNGEYWLLTTKDGTQYSFQSDAPNRLRWIQDRFGNQINFSYNGGMPDRLTTPNGRYITLSYGSGNQIVSAVDNSGRTVSYAYNPNGTLASVTYPDHTSEKYTYDEYLRMLSMQDRRGTIWVTNQYDSAGRVIKQTFADNTFYQFNYTVDVSNIVTATVITAPDGNQERVTFDPVSQYMASDTQAYGTSLAQTTTYQREASGLIDAQTDALGRKTAYTYDTVGNVTSVTRLAGTSEANTTQFTYEPVFNQLTSVTDPLGHASHLSYTDGCLTGITDALGHSTQIQCNVQGLPTAITDPLGHTTVLAYQGSDLQSITDPIHRTVSYETDNVGRPVATRDPRGNVTLTQYDSNNRVVAVTDALNHTTGLNYDGNGNLLSVALPNQALYQYGYDVRNRRTSRTDAMGQQDAWTYDGMGRVLTHTDRKNQVTELTYDALGRSTLVSYADGSGTQASYDAANRLTDLTDTSSGVLHRNYDDLDRLISETTAQGSVSYAYDAAGRRTSMTAAAQATVNYAYDDANRLASLVQGNENVQFAYDDSNRRTQLTLPNGVTVKYGYDDANELTAMTYAKADGTAIGDLAYGYDILGHRIQKSGSLATDTPPAVRPQPSTFDLDSRLTAFNGQAMSYDANGNLINDGISTYTWNARNQLVQVSQGQNVEFAYSYDAIGRRTAKSVNSGTPTQYLYDGANAVQEQQGSAINPILTGLGVDERFARNDVTGRTYFLTDALNSTIALTDSNGAIRQQYSYDPYGNVTPSDTTSGFTNPYQYTGREADSAGLYYYRARYYSPVMGNFIGEDSVGFGGKQASLYAYAGENPVSFSDPLGLAKYTQVPNDAAQYVTGGGAFFYAPPSADFNNVFAEGALSGSDLLAMKKFEGQGGENDYQRQGGDFYSKYTDASNYGVGVYMNGAGFSADQTVFIGEFFATYFSSNAGDPKQVFWWLQGWNDAENKHLAEKLWCKNTELAGGRS